jgi:hypothetical protein
MLNHTGINKFVYHILGCRTVLQNMNLGMLRPIRKTVVY